MKSKTVFCSYTLCNKSRESWYDTDGKPQKISVSADHEGPMFCSITCYCLATKTKVTDIGKSETGYPIRDSDW